MYLFEILVLRMIILMVIRFNQPQVYCLTDNKDGILNSITRMIQFIDRKDDSKKDFWGREIKDENIGWFNLGRKTEIQRDNNSKISWFTRLQKLNFHSTHDLDEVSLSNKEQTMQDASKSLNQSNLDILMPYFNYSNYNLFNYYNFSTFKLSNYNFNFSNWQLPKMYYANELNYSSSLPNINFTINFDTSKDLLSSFPFATLKARYYGNLLNNRTSVSDNLINSTIPSSLNEFKNDLINFRERLINVYNNYTSCIHPCSDTQIKRNAISAKITINGCGPSYFSERQLKLIPYGEFFKDCCNIHDSNYANCGLKKQEADYNFLDCMLNTINKTSVEDKNIWPRIRKTFGYALFGLVDRFGCKAWEISQKEVCFCE